MEQQTVETLDNNSVKHDLHLAAQSQENSLELESDDDYFDGSPAKGLDSENVAENIEQFE